VTNADPPNSHWFQKLQSLTSTSPDGSPRSHDLSQLLAESNVHQKLSNMSALDLIPFLVGDTTT
jgi:hypothetical protein